MNDKKIYVWTLSMTTLLGRRECDIFYVRHKGDVPTLFREAYRRGININSISIRDYRNAVRGSGIR